MQESSQSTAPALMCPVGVGLFRVFPFVGRHGCCRQALLLRPVRTHAAIFLKLKSKCPNHRGRTTKFSATDPKTQVSSIYGCSTTPSAHPFALPSVAERPPQVHPGLRRLLLFRRGGGAGMDGRDLGALRRPFEVENFIGREAARFPQVTDAHVAAF